MVAGGGDKCDGQRKGVRQAWWSVPISEHHYVGFLELGSVRRHRLRRLLFVMDVVVYGSRTVFSLGASFLT